MDPISQGVLGAVVPQSVSNKNEIRVAALIGSVAGVVPDIDVLFRSSEDPLMFIEYHRGFTHSLAFIPIGSFIVACMLWVILRRRLSFGRTFFYSLLGYATHGFLDACTNYGTMLYLPFSDERVAWNIISILDPLFTFPLLFFVIFALVNRSPLVSRIGLALALIYLVFGIYQRENAEDVLEKLAHSRGHKIERSVVHPTIGNTILWRSVYQSGGRYYADGIRISPVSQRIVYEGSSLDKFEPDQDYPGLEKDSVLYRDIKRFAHFANGFVALHPEYPNVVGDLRYSLLPNGTLPLWGIKIDPSEQDEHVSRERYQEVDNRKLEIFWNMVKGEHVNSYEEK